MPPRSIMYHFTPATCCIDRDGEVHQKRKRKKGEEKQKKKKGGGWYKRREKQFCTHGIGCYTTSSVPF